MTPPSTWCLQIGGRIEGRAGRRLSVVLVALFAFLGERLSAREWLGIALVAAGVVELALRR